MNGCFCTITDSENIFPQKVNPILYPLNFQFNFHWFCLERKDHRITEMFFECVDYYIWALHKLLIGRFEMMFNGII